MSFASGVVQIFETGKFSQNPAYYELAQDNLLARFLTQEIIIL